MRCLVVRTDRQHLVHGFHWHNSNNSNDIIITEFIKPKTTAMHNIMSHIRIRLRVTNECVVLEYCCLGEGTINRASNYYVCVRQDNVMIPPLERYRNLEHHNIIHNIVMCESYII